MAVCVTTYCGVCMEVGVKLTYHKANTAQQTDTQYDDIPLWCSLRLTPIKNHIYIVECFKQQCPKNCCKFHKKCIFNFQEHATSLHLGDVMH